MGILKEKEANLKQNDFAQFFAKTKMEDFQLNISW